MGAYVFLIFSGSGQLSGLETLFGADDLAASRAAPALLPSDAAAGRVEVWCDAELVNTVGSTPPGADWGL